MWLVKFSRSYCYMSWLFSAASISLSGLQSKTTVTLPCCEYIVGHWQATSQHYISVSCTVMLHCETRHQPASHAATDVGMHGLLACQSCYPLVWIHCWPAADFFIAKQTSLHPFDFVRNLFHYFINMSQHILDIYNDHSFNDHVTVSWPV